VIVQVPRDCEKLPSAVHHYVEDLRRICYVLGEGLTEKNQLVGDKSTIAELPFVPWNELDMILSCPAKSKLCDFLRVKTWHESLIARSS
jgi:glutathione S-transferase